MSASDDRRKPPSVPTESVDDYLKSILELEQDEDRVTTSALARHRGVTPASVSGMIRRLATEQPPFVEYEKHRGVRLTEHGRRRALEILRHHRLLESFLHDKLGYSWDEVHAEAERLEHAISEKLEDRIAEDLGDPEVDPHGHPIPRKDGTVPRRDETRLLELDAGRRATISRVSDEDAELLRYLASLGLTLGAWLVVRSRAPFEGPLEIETARGSCTVSRHVAGDIYVSEVEGARTGGGDPRTG